MVIQSDYIYNIFQGGRYTTNQFYMDYCTGHTLVSTYFLQRPVYQHWIGRRLPSKATQRRNPRPSRPGAAGANEILKRVDQLLQMWSRQDGIFDLSIGILSSGFGDSDDQ